MPPPPRATQHHPSSVDLELVKRLLRDTRCKTLAEFLRKEFACIGAEYAGASAGCLVDAVRTSANDAAAWCCM